MQDSNQFFKNKIKNIKLEADIIKTIQKWIGKKYTIQEFQILEIELLESGKIDSYKIKTQCPSMQDSLILYLEGQAIHTIIY